MSRIAVAMVWWGTNLTPQLSFPNFSVTEVETRIHSLRNKVGRSGGLNESQTCFPFKDFFC